MKKQVSARRGRRSGIEKKRWMTSVVCLSMLLGMSFALVQTPSVRAQSPSEVWVDDDFNATTPGWGVDHFNKIYLGINAVAVEGIVRVDPGNYDETFTISKNLSIVENGTGDRVVAPTSGGTITITITNSAHVNISGLTIHEQSSEVARTGVFINETSHANISNCSFLDLNLGISIEDGSSARIENSFFHQIVDVEYNTNAARFVVLQQQSKGEDTVISNNTAIFKFRAHAIVAYKTAIHLVENNSLYQNYSGLNCYDREDLKWDGAISLYQHSAPGWTTVRNNTASGFCWGVSTEGANATVENNTFTDSHIGISSFGYYDEGTEEQYTSNLTVANNTVTFKKYGLQVMHYWSYINAANNNITGSGLASGEGVRVENTGRLDFGPNNTVSNASLGVKTYSNTFTNASGNVFFGTREGFHSEGTDNIHHNEFYSNEEGIRIQSNPKYGNRNISNNTITGSSVRAGIWVYASTNSDEIQNNEITQGVRGIWITDGSSSKLIRWNNVSDNYYGIHIEPYESSSPGSNDVKGNNISMNEYGIYVYESDNNDFQNNNVSGNRRSGIFLDSVESAKIEHSNISNNFMGIVLRGEPPPVVSSLSIKENSILGNTLWAINSSIPDQIDARDNFFGAWNNDSIKEMISGDITVDPWLQYRESNVEIVDFMSIPSFPHPSPYYVEKGMIVNGTLEVGPDADIIFNNSLGQNFIQVDNATNLKNADLQGANESFTLLFLDSTNGRIEHSNISGFRGLGIQSGEEILEPNGGIVLHNSDFYQSSNGVVLHRARNTLVEESSFISNTLWGMYLHSSTEIDMSDNNISHNRHGFHLEESAQNNITGNEFYSNTFSGLTFEEFWPSAVLWSVREHSVYNDVTNNTFIGNNIGALLGNVSKLNNVTESNFTANVDGIYITGSWSDGNHRAALNEFYGNDNGVHIEEAIYNNISKNSYVSNDRGIFVEDSTPFVYPFSGITNKITNNSILNGNQGEKGIYLDSSERNFIHNNSVNSTFSGEKDTDTWGIHLKSSDTNFLSWNVIQTNEHGIRLDDSPNNNLTFNNMTNNFYNFGVTGTEIDHFPQEINTSNLVNGTEVYYWVGVNGSEVPSNAGYVGLISCSNISVPNVTIHNNLQGILLVNTTHSTIQKVTVNWTLVGVRAFMSANITVTGYGTYRSVFKDNKVGVQLLRTNYSRVEYSNFTDNSFAGVHIYGVGGGSDLSLYAHLNNVSRVNVTADEWCEYGIRLDFVAYTTISNSTVDNCRFGISMDGLYLDLSNTIKYTNMSNNGKYGLRLRASKKNFVVNNSFYQNEVGISVRGISMHNEIYHNNFQGNTKSHHEVYVNPNTWDNGYPEPDPLPDGGGNWWSGVPCTDDYSGPGQNESGSDGICDTPYNLNEDPYETNVDHYPLVAPATVGPQDE